MQVQAQNALLGSPKTLLSLHCQGECPGEPSRATRLQGGRRHSGFEFGNWASQRPCLLPSPRTGHFHAVWKPDGLRSPPNPTRGTGLLDARLHGQRWGGERLEVPRGQEWRAERERSGRTRDPPHLPPALPPQARGAPGVCPLPRWAGSAGEAVPHPPASQKPAWRRSLRGWTPRFLFLRQHRGGSPRLLPHLPAPGGTGVRVLSCLLHWQAFRGPSSHGRCPAPSPQTAGEYPGGGPYLSPAWPAPVSWERVWGARAGWEGA